MRTVLALAAAALLLAGATPPSEMSLRTVMMELHGDYLRLSSALLYGDVAGARQAARAIERHPMPPGLVAAIRSRLGARFEDFEKADLQTHAAAARIERAGGAAAAAKAYGDLTLSCVACHSQFRPKLLPLADRRFPGA